MVKHVHVAIIAAFVAITCCAGCAGCTCANAQTVDETFREVSDALVARNVEADEQARFDCLASWHEARAARAAEQAEQAAQEAAADTVDNQGGYYEAEYLEPEYYEQTYYEDSYNMPTDGLTQSGGVNYYGGRTETYYSSKVAYHYRTPEWTVDDEGFYRTDEGYYVVAASDMPEGTVFDGSKGECMVLDCGCDDGITDYYVAW